MTIFINETSGKYNCSFQNAENISDALKKIGELIFRIGVSGDFPTVVTAESDSFEVSYSLTKRGSYITDDGKKHPSLLVSEKKFRLFSSVQNEPSAMDFAEKYLTCIHKESNNYKFYRFEPVKGTSLITASYGRIGNENSSRHLKNPFPARQFWAKYYEKLSKGYIDRTPDSFAKTESEDMKSSAKSFKNKIWSELYGYAENNINNSLEKGYYLTEQTVKDSVQYFNRMAKCKTVKGFNRNLEHLLALNPRKVNVKQGVKRLYAETVADFENIIDREESLLNSIKAMVFKDDFADSDVEIYKATSRQKEEVIKHISPSMRNQVEEIYRIIPKNQKKKFDSYLKKNNIKTIRQLWHGSRNCNWFSIINESLSLSPNAIITGKMFGNGIYFAEKSLKSLNYTSLKGSYWSNGQDNVGFLGLYATAYGNPYETRKHGENCSESQLKQMGCDCLHAKKENTGLREDEIVFFNEDSVLLNYLVKFSLD